MNSFTHFIVAFNILFAFFGDSEPLMKILMFSIIFGVGPDIDIVVRRITHPKLNHKRTFFQEPIGLIIIALPISILMSNPYLVLIPYASHLILDYLTTHFLFPLAPFSKKVLFIKGIFHPMFPGKWAKKARYAPVSEWYLFIPNLLLMIIFIKNSFN